MACDLTPQCNFLYSFFQCNLPEDTIDVYFRKYHSSQSSVSSLWGYMSKTFPIASKKDGSLYCKSRRVHGGCYILAKAAKPIFMHPPTLVTIPQAAATDVSVFVQPPNNYNTVQAQSEIGQSRITLNFCHLCTPAGRKCPNNYLSANHPEW